MTSIYDDFPINHPIWNVSDPIKVRDNYHKYYKEHIERIKQLTGSDAEVYPSSRKNKKYMVFNGVNMTHFGDLNYSDYSKTLDKTKQRWYWNRFSRWRDYDVYSPYRLSLYLLW
jgi:hypothetical protein